MGRKLEYIVVIFAVAIAFGYTNLPTVSQLGNQFASQIDNRLNGISPISPLLDTGTIIQGNIAGKAGVSTDQIGTTQALAQINHEVCVDGYGAVHNGTTDDGAAIQAAVDACGNSGCVVKFDCTSGITTPQTYLIDSYRPSGSGAGQILGSPAGVDVYYSNIVIDLNGATLKAGATPSTTHPMLTLGSDFGPSPCFESSTLYAVTGATVGSSVLTMVTAGQEANFAAGNYMYIEGEHTDNNNKGQDVVVSVDSTAHKVYLRYPLPRVYTPTPAIGPETGTSGVHTCVSQNITLKNGTILVPSGSHMRGLGMYLVDGFVMENINQDMESATGGGDSPTNIAISHGVFRHNNMTGACSPSLDLASRGNGYITVENSTHEIHDVGGTGCGISEVAGVAEGVEHITFHHNTLINNVVGSSTSLVNNGVTFGPGSAYTTFDDNDIYVAHGVNSGGFYAVGIGHQTGSPLPFGVKATNNRIWIDAGRALNLRSGDYTVAIGNTVFALGSGALICGVLGEGGGVFNGNFCNMVSQDVPVQNTVTGWAITSNLFSNSTTGAAYPIQINDFSNPASDSIVVGNIDLTPGNFSASPTCFTTLGGTHSNLRRSSNSPKGSCADQ